MMKLKRESLYNFAFFGGQRDNCVFDGHYAFITDLKEFVFYKVADYGGFMWVRDNLQKVELSENQYRYVHDAVLDATKHMIGEDLLMQADSESEELWNTCIKYKLQGKRISANIHRGDTVINLLDNTTFKVDHYHDIDYINRDFHYKIVDREVHPPKATLNEFKLKLGECVLFSGWNVCELPNKGLNNFDGDLIINGNRFKLNSHFPDKAGADTYYITTPEKTTYFLKSSIRSPFCKMIDLLTGFVHMQYVDGCPVYHCIHEVINDLSNARSLFSDGSKNPTRFKHFTEKESYYYNTRMTYL